MNKKVLAIVVGIGAAAILLPATTASASTPTLYVSPGASNVADSSCAAAGYGTIQSAVNAAAAGDKIVVCAGTYPEQVTITTSNLTLMGQGIAIIQPTSATTDASDLDSTQPIVSILAVESPAKGVHVSNLTIDGSGIESSVDGCSDDLVGLLYQASSGTATATIGHVTVENVTPSNSGCGSGLGIFVQGGTTGTAKATVTVSNSSVSGYGKNGITCGDVGIKCTITTSSITTTPTGLVAQNGVQVGFGAAGSVSGNTISGNFWTAYATDTSNPQPQSDYGAGVLLYAAGINASGATTVSTTVKGNHLTNNQIGVEVVDSAASVTGNSILESSPGIADSIGIYGVGCDGYCSFFTANNGDSLDSVAASNQAVTVSGNTINFASPAPSGSYGIWLGEQWIGGGGYAAPAGTEKVSVTNPGIHNVTHLLVIDAGATF